MSKNQENNQPTGQPAKGTTANKKNASHNTLSNFGGLMTSGLASLQPARNDWQARARRQKAQNKARIDENRPRGIENVAGDCFAISAIQALFSCQIIVDTLHRVEVEESTETHAGEKLIEFFKEYYYGPREDQINARALIQALGFEAGAPNDAEEFFSKLGKLEELSPLLQIGINTILKCPKECYEKKREDSDYKIYLYPTNSETIVELLSRAFELPEEMDSNCAHKLTHDDAVKQVTFSNLSQPLPPVIVIYLSIFHSENEKLNHQILFPAALDMTPYATKCDNPSGMLYSLKSVVYHSGCSTETGHYQTLIKRNETFYLCNDNDIQYSSQENAGERASPYMAFYERI